MKVIIKESILLVGSLGITYGNILLLLLFNINNTINTINHYIKRLYVCYLIIHFNYKQKCNQTINTINLLLLLLSVIILYTFLVFVLYPFLHQDYQVLFPMYLTPQLPFPTFFLILLWF